MRIGEFAKTYGITVDTIRYYMDLQLLLPNKKGGQYFFNKNDSQDLEDILELKSLKFSLTEIKKIFAYSRLTHLRSIEDRNYFRRILVDKKQQMEREEEEIKKVLEILESKINRIDKMNALENRRLGIPVQFIGYFSCPYCNKDLSLIEGKVENNMVMEGYFQCQCGYKGHIENGIYISLTEEDLEKIIAVGGAPTLAAYAEEETPALINFMYKAIDTIVHILRKEELENRVLLEVGTGSGFLLRKLIADLPIESFYIVNDNRLESIHAIKGYLQQQSQSPHFVFICTDINKLPIKNNTVDYAIDYSTSITYHLVNNQFLCQVLLPKLNKGGKLVSCHTYVKEESKLLQLVPDVSKDYYRKKGLMKALNNLSLVNTKIRELGHLEAVGKYEKLLDGSRFSQILFEGIVSDE